jgi:outer membrane protein assembly factor BamB
MLVTNYFQVRGVSPLETEIMETLKELNEASVNNLALQEQIRQLDLMSRKAYFVGHDRLMNGVCILLGMLAVFLVCARLYFSGVKDIPDKEIDPVDEWATKTKARQYVIWGALGLAATTLVFVVLSSPHLRFTKTEKIAVNTQFEENTSGTDTELVPAISQQETNQETDTSETSEISEASETSETSAEPAKEPAVQPTVSHNAFRGNSSNGTSAAKNVPVKWDLAKGTNILWKREIPRKGYNSPVISGNRVFFTGADAETRELFCYDLATGKQLWTLAATDIPGSPERAPETTDDTGLAAASVAANGKQICAIFGTGDLICADMDGNRLWAKNIGVPDNHYGFSSSLLMLGNLLFVQFDDRKTAKVIAYDAATGTERWNKTRQNKLSWSSPVIAYVNNAPQLALMGELSLIAYNPYNGEQLWRVDGFYGEPGASPCSAAGVVYVSGDHSKFVAVNAVDGTVLWEKNDFLTEVASLVATKDNIFMATTYGLVVSFDAKTGEPRVEHELGEQFYSSPMMVEGKIYLFDMEGKMYIFSADDDFKLLDSFATGEKTVATPAFTDGKIVVRTEKSIYCVAVK